MKYMKQIITFTLLGIYSQAVFAGNIDLGFNNNISIDNQLKNSSAIESRVVSEDEKPIELSQEDIKVIQSVKSIPNYNANTQIPDYYTYVNRINIPNTATIAPATSNVIASLGNVPADKKDQINPISPTADGNIIIQDNSIKEPYTFLTSKPPKKVHVSISSQDKNKNVAINKQVQPLANITPQENLSFSQSNQYSMWGLSKPPIISEK